MGRKPFEDAGADMTEAEVEALVAEQMRNLPPGFYADHSADYSREPYVRRAARTRPSRRRSHVETRA